jgi:uncharacterized protein YqgQ
LLKSKSKSIKNQKWSEERQEISTLVEHSNKVSALALRKVQDDLISKWSGKKPEYGYIKEDIMTLHMSMFLRKRSRMNRAINIKIDQLIESGIMQRLEAAYFANSTKVANKQKEDEKQHKPKQLTMEHLEICFYAVLIGLALSCVAFLCELLFGYLSSLFRKLLL